jgi:hypothetical protein
MPKTPDVKRITDRIAEDYWAYRSLDGHHTISRLVVGRPRRWRGDPQGDWICPVMIDGFTHGVATMAGVGPIDALLNAVKVIQAFAEEIREFTPRARDQERLAMSKAPLLNPRTPPKRGKKRRLRG